MGENMPFVLENFVYYISDRISLRSEDTLILSGLAIKQHIGREIIIDPFDEARLNPNSYNLSLHDELLTYKARHEAR